jgi:hypothetical protein
MRATDHALATRGPGIRREDGQWQKQLRCVSPVAIDTGFLYASAK